MAWTRTLTRTNRVGTFMTAAYTVPAGATGRFVLNADISTADRANPAYSVSVQLYVSDDGGQTWRHDSGLTWRGDPDYVPKPGQTLPWPSLIVPDVSELAGKQVRAEISIPVRFAVGAQVQLFS